MEIKIDKEIRDYTENIYFGLNLRQFICALLGIAVSVGLYFILRGHLEKETLSWVCMLGAFPFVAIGFLKYNAYPAKIFMGDTGSLAIGGALGGLSVITKHEFAIGS